MCECNINRKPYIAGSLNKFCSTKCSANSKKTQDKRRATNMDRHGAEFILQTKEGQAKKTATNLDRLGVEHAAQSQEIKDKTAKTCLERYNVEFASQIPEKIEKSKQTNLDRYGVESTFQVEEFKEKSKQTLMERYDVDNVSKSQEIKNKKIDTSLKNYKTIHPTQSKIVQEKTVKTNNERYGSDRPQQNKEVQEKTRNTNMNRYGVSCVFANKEVRAKCVETMTSNKGYYGSSKLKHIDPKDYIDLHIDDVVKKYNISKDTYYTSLRYHNIQKKHSSSFEHSIQSFLASLGIEFISNTRSLIKPLEIDIYIPSHNLAIECDGVYWHSESQGKDKNYHINKTVGCEEQGIQLLHIFDTEWNEKQNIVKSIIKSKLGLSKRIYARKCDVRVVGTTDKTKFLNLNHRQGACSSSTNLGLYYNNELVSLMTFSKSRFTKKYDYELTRFCNKLGVSVVGGASRLLKRFRRDNKGSVVSYADKRYSDGGMYKQLGFTYTHTSAPNYWYFKYKEMYSRVQCQKHKLEGLLDVFDGSLSESVNMKNNGFERIYDCGNLVYCLDDTV